MGKRENPEKNPNNVDFAFTIISPLATPIVEFEILLVTN